MANADQIQKMAKVVAEFAKTSEVPFQNPGEFHTKFFGHMYDQSTEDNKAFIIAIRDVIFAHITPRMVSDPGEFHSKYDAMVAEWVSLMAEIKVMLLPMNNDILDSMFYPAMLPRFFERTLACCGFQYLTGS